MVISLLFYINFFNARVAYPISTRPRAILEHKFFFISRVPSLISNILAIILAVFVASKMSSYLGFLTWRFALPFFEMLWFGKMYINLSKVSLNYKSEERAYWKFCLPIWGSGMLVFAAGNIDYFIISQMMTKEELGLYWLCFQYGNYLLQFRTIFITFLTPLFVKLTNKDDRLTIFKLILDILILMPSTIILFLLVNRDSIISLNFGVLSQNVEFFCIIISGFIFRLYSTFLEIFAVTERRTTILLVSSIGTSVIFLLLLLLLIPLFGLFGAAIAFLISSLVIMLYSFSIYSRYMEFRQVLRSLLFQIGVIGIIFGVIIFANLFLGQLISASILVVLLLYIGFTRVTLYRNRTNNYEQI